LISDDKPIGTDWEEILILEEIIFHSLMCVVSIVLLCIIYKVFGGRGFPSVEHSVDICPHPMSQSCCYCSQYAGRATYDTCENHNFVYSFIFVHLFILFQVMFSFGNEIGMEEILHNCNCNFDMCPFVTQFQFIVKHNIIH